MDTDGAGSEGPRELGRCRDRIQGLWRSSRWRKGVPFRVHGCQNETAGSAPRGFSSLGEPAGKLRLGVAFGIVGCAEAAFFSCKSRRCRTARTATSLRRTASAAVTARRPRWRRNGGVQQAVRRKKSPRKKRRKKRKKNRRREEVNREKEVKSRGLGGV